jgi:hypothetical protein
MKPFSTTYATPMRTGTTMFTPAPYGAGARPDTGDADIDQRILARPVGRKISRYRAERGKQIGLERGLQ